MAGAEDMPVAANVLGCMSPSLPTRTARAHFLSSFWCIQLLPQIWSNWKTKQTDGLPSAMMLLWAVSAVPFGTYAVVQHFNTPLQIQPQLFCTLALISWAQILVYRNGWSWPKASAYAIITACVFGGVEAALILTLTPLYDRGISYPMIIVGVIASILLAAGLLPPYYEMWKRHGRVVGINLFFIVMDWFGAFFSLMALVAQNHFDVLGGVLYIICLVLEIGIVASHAIWLLRTRGVRREAGEEGKTFDEVVREKEERGEKWKFAERRVDVSFGRRGKGGKEEGVVDEEAGIEVVEVVLREDSDVKGEERK